ncbi:G-protein coupled receptor [Purpureocillium lilacinum]|uniref:G-protein coupled receptor n=1 Tax=Purpureocillium lilacinum TaxID=33203 RepID=A0A179G1Q3_PURLI|nr:G-protein coupled receptor [Purpureocillium lilacinum]
MGATIIPSFIGLSAKQLSIVGVIQQVGAAFSILGCIFIISTFCFCDAFHKPINRLVFYASLGNLMASVGFAMACMYLDKPNSAGCQMQAFLLHLFVSADACWTLAMAINVYLTFYFRFDARRLRKMEIPYLVVCYGLPFIPAFSYLFIRDKSGIRVYGSAGMWCWIVPRWDYLRIATFYGPVWGTIVITLAIYLRSGGTIYRKRQQLRKLQETSSVGMSSITRGGIDPIMTNIKTTEVVVTSEIVSPAETMEMQALGGHATAHATTTAPRPRDDDDDDADDGMDEEGEEEVATHSGPQATGVSGSGGGTGGGGVVQRPRRQIHQEISNAAWQYTKCAILFFIVILVTWTPSSANRVHAFINPHEISVPLQYMSATVLPLQGFWNAIIYAVTSWAACKRLFRQMKAWIAQKRGKTGAGVGNGQPSADSRARSSWIRSQEDAQSSSRGRGSKRGPTQSVCIEGDSESMRVLAKSAQGSDDMDGRSVSVAPSRSEA